MLADQEDMRKPLQGECMQSPYESFLGRFGSFTDIQRMAVGPVGSGRNCLLTAPTGSGKTEAALLPVLNRIYRHGRGRGVQVLYITPLRALNRDLMLRLEWLCKASGITIGVRHGDITARERAAQAASPPDLLITTPESLQTLFLSGRLKRALAAVGAVIVDEIHELYHNKRGAQLSIGLERVRALAGNFQRIGISATVGDTDTATDFLFGKEKFDVVRALNVKEFRISIEMPESPEKEHRDFRETFGLDRASVARMERISSLIKGSDATILFTNTRQAAESIGSKLLFLNKTEDFGNVGVHHSSLDREERVRVENSFKEGRIKGIIATSSLELGIDVGRVDLVLQYGSPKQPARLIQRVGRSGHGEGRVSNGKIIVGEALDALEAYVIAGDVARGRLESRGIERNAYDVLSNQICAIAIEYKRIEADRVYGIVTGAAPYRNLERKDFDRVLALAHELKLIGLRDGFVSVGSRGLSYFFSNISVIPDSIRFSVKDIVSNRVVSSLDERFVYNYLDVDSSFISKGVPWKVVDIDGNMILAEPSGNAEAAVPDWEGEDIPVSHADAAAVFAAMGAGGKLPGFLDSGARSRVLAFIGKQRKYFLPSPERLFIEEVGDFWLIYSGLGKLANEFISKVLGPLIGAGPGSAVRATPYAVVVEFGDVAVKPDMEKVIGMLASGTSEDKMLGLVSASDAFRYKFIQVAKLFGVIDKKATVTKAAATRLVEFYRSSPVFEEALRDVNKNNFDAGTAHRFLEKLRNGEIRPAFVAGGGSPLSYDILRSAYHYRELMMPGLPTDKALREFKDRMDGKSVKLLCTFCGFVSNEEIALDKDKAFLCHSCKSPMLAIDREAYEGPIKRKAAGRKLGPGDLKAYESALNEAGLISAYGNRAVIALSTYGVGALTAARLLKYVRGDFARFYIDLMEAQRIFVRTKRFWKG